MTTTKQAHEIMKELGLPLTDDGERLFRHYTMTRVLGFTLAHVNNELVYIARGEEPIAWEVVQSTPLSFFTEWYI